MAHICMHGYVSGRVQGVRFRQTTAEQAERLELSGWVRNRRDGSLEAIVEAREATPHQLRVRLCNSGVMAGRAAPALQHGLPFLTTGDHGHALPALARHGNAVPPHGVAVSVAGTREPLAQITCRRPRQLERLELGAAKIRQPRDVELAGPFVLEAGEGGVFTKDLVLVLIGEPLAKAEPASQLGQRPPVGPGLPRQGQKGTLAADGGEPMTNDTWYTGPGILQSVMVGANPSHMLIAHTPIEDGVIKVWYGLFVKVKNAVPTDADRELARGYEQAGVAARETRNARSRTVREGLGDAVEGLGGRHARCGAHRPRPPARCPAAKQRVRTWLTCPRCTACRTGRRR